MKNTTAAQQYACADHALEPTQRIHARLISLYGEAQADILTPRILRIMEVHQQLRERSVKGPYWTHKDVVLITYADIIHSPSRPPLQTLRSFLTRHLPIELTMVHLLPFFPYSSDDGFSVTDFRAVDPRLGTWEDVAALESNYDLAIDLVLNHCSRENLWFIDFIAGQAPACDYFIEMEPDPSLALVTRPRSTPLLSGVRTHRGLRQVWTTFSNDQIDLNYQNPNVLLEFIDILLYYLRRGARMIRLDAVAYLWKQLGTECIHHPNTHEVVKLFRDILDIIEPGALIMTETNVPHEQNISYFGEGDEAHIIYQFSLPPLLLHALFSANTTYLQQWAKQLECATIPAHCTFFNFTASHDGVGLRPLEGLIPAEELATMMSAMRARGGYVSTKRNSDGSESPYELNISYFDAFRNPIARKNQWQVSAFFVSQIVALSFKGIPAVYFHSLTATQNDHLSVERTGMTRAINRRKWDQSELEALLNNKSSDTAKVFSLYKHLLQIRRKQKAFHPDAAQEVLTSGPSTFVLQRTAPDHSQTILAIFNFTDQQQYIDKEILPNDLQRWQELIGTSEADCTPLGLRLTPYATLWFSINNTD